MIWVVPHLLLTCGWSCRAKPKGAYWQGRSGVRTYSLSRYGTPYGPCRYIVLYLAAKAAEHGRRFHASLQDMTEQLGLKWSRKVALARFDQVANCLIERSSRYHSISPRFSIVSCLGPLKDGRFDVTVSMEFMRDVEQGAPCDLAIIKAMSKKSYAALDVYLWMRWAMEQIKRGRRVLQPRKFLALASMPFRAYQQIRKHLTYIRSLWPDCPFKWSDAKLVAPDVLPPPHPRRSANRARAAAWAARMERAAGVLTRTLAGKRSILGDTEPSNTS